MIQVLRHLDSKLVNSISAVITSAVWLVCFLISGALKSLKTDYLKRSYILSLSSDFAVVCSINANTNDDVELLLQLKMAKSLKLNIHLGEMSALCYIKCEVEKVIVI